MIVSNNVKMTKKLVLCATLAMCVFSAKADEKIKYYFNKPVDNSVSKGVNAVYLNSAIDDTLIAYINRAKYTIDVAVYNFTSSAPGVAVAINNAYVSRGVTVRWIYDAAQDNSGLPSLNSGINTLGSPTSSAYTIMHNKFVVIDANSTNPNDAIVWTGSANWNNPQFSSDYNNVVVLQDSGLAHAYRDHFNMMWGGSGATPNLSASKFGSFKTDLGRHSYMIDGKRVDVFFSPADGVNNKILAAMNTADKDLYFGMSTFTHTSNASLFVNKHNTGVYVAGISDNANTSSSVTSILNGGLGTLYKPFVSSSTLYHNKFVIVDPSDPCSDPIVITGSHNFSVSADTKNDENTLIIYDDTAANVYYQSFKANYAALGGSLTAINGCPTATADLAQIMEQVQLFPNPTDGMLTISYPYLGNGTGTLTISNLLGQVLNTYQLLGQQATNTFSFQISQPGFYFVTMAANGSSLCKKVVVE